MGVSTNDLPNGGWVIHNKRYDLRDFVDRHPGGAVMMRMGEGRNCTELYESYHRMVDFDKVRTILQKYYVEDVLPGDPLYDDDFEWESTPFYDSLSKKTREYFQSRNLSHKAPALKWAYLLALNVLLAYCYYSFICGAWWSIVVMPTVYWLGPSGMMHDGSHFALSESALVNKFCSYFGSAHVSLTSWYHQHVIGHHAKTNMADKDPDHYHFKQFAKYVYGFRSHWQHRWKPAYLMWQRGVAFMSTLTTFGPAFLLDMHGVMVGTFNSVVPYWHMGKSEIVVHFIGRAIMLGMLVVLPYLLFPLPKAIVFAMVPYAVHGILYYVFSQVSHVNTTCLGTYRGLNNEWGIHQVQHCLDWSPLSFLACLASIGLNTQTQHHLFPSIDPWHFAATNSILVETCAEHGVEYKPVPSLIAALQDHLGFLRFVNEGFRAQAPRPDDNKPRPFPNAPASKGAEEMMKPKTSDSVVHKRK